VGDQVADHDADGEGRGQGQPRVVVGEVRVKELGKAKSVEEVVDEREGPEQLGVKLQVIRVNHAGPPVGGAWTLVEDEPSRNTATTGPLTSEACAS
jgi:hypothetical protein